MKVITVQIEVAQDCGHQAMREAADRELDERLQSLASKVDINTVQREYSYRCDTRPLEDGQGIRGIMIVTATARWERK